MKQKIIIAETDEGLAVTGCVNSEFVFHAIDALMQSLANVKGVSKLSIAKGMFYILERKGGE